jgi:amidase
MTGLDVERTSAEEIARLLDARELSCEDVATAYLGRMAELNDGLNVYLHIDEERTLARARALDAEGRSGIAGVPIAYKDLLCIRGVPTTAGSRVLEGYRPPYTATVVRRCEAEGLVELGKTNMDEFAMGSSTENSGYGPTRNPWDRERVPGGSSGGSAAAVAAGVVPMAHATDGGGSIRIPASCCGLFGLKPTRARNPMGPDAGEGWGGASVGHAVTRTVRDSAALLDATSGPDIGDPYWAPPPARPFLEEVGRDPGRLRIAITTRPWNGQPVDPECAEAAIAAGRLCDRLGHHVEEATPDVDARALGDATLIIVSANIRATLEARAAALGRELAAGDVERLTWARAVDGHTARAADYARSIGVVHRIGRVVARFFTRYDLLLSPTMCRPPYPLGVLDLMTNDVERYTEAILGSIGFTALFNSAGSPAMSVPLAWSRAGLPIGVQFAARFGDEATLFRLGAQLESAQPWAERRPPSKI